MSDAEIEIEVRADMVEVRTGRKPEMAFEGVQDLWMHYVTTTGHLIE